MGEALCIIHCEAEFLSSCESVKLDQLCAPKMQRKDRHKIDISTPQGRNKKEGRGDRQV